MGSIPTWGPRGTKLECVYFFSYVESSRRSRASTHLVLPQENTRSPPHLHTNAILAAAAGVRGPAGTRTTENSPGCRTSMRCKPAFMAACSMVPMDVDGTPRDSSDLSRRCAVWARPNGWAARRWLALSHPFSGVSLSGLQVHINGCSSRRPAIAFT
jgi:hypothetical protein